MTWEVWVAPACRKINLSPGGFAKILEDQQIGPETNQPGSLGSLRILGSLGILG
jgi:hypothetical protein